MFVRLAGSGIPIDSRNASDNPRLVMEEAMFSIKFDPLFPDMKAAKALARILNADRPARADFDPRELARIKDELRAAREHVKAQAMLHRYHVI